MASKTEMHELKVVDHMTKNPITIHSSAMLPEAVSIMVSKKLAILL